MTPAEPDFPALYAHHVATMAARFETALAETDLDGVVIFSGEPRYYPRDDTTAPFRVDPWFTAWLPLTDVPGSALVVSPGRRPLVIYRQDDGFWHAPPDDPEGFWTGHFDIEIAKSGTAARSLLAGLSGRYAAIGAPDGGPASDGFVDHAALLARLDFSRAAKTDYEIACIARANSIAAAGHLAVGAAFSEDVSEYSLNRAGPGAAFRAGASEYSLHQTYLGATGQCESELPYASIVAMNAHAAILHYQRLDRAAPAETRSLLIDAGARFKGYAADVSRTWGAPDAGFAELLESMEALQQTLCAEVRAGVDFTDLNERTHELVAGVLSEHGLVNRSADEAHASGITRTFLPHGLGHLLGLQVHDVGGRQSTPTGELRPAPEPHPFLRLTRVLEPGFSLTIEPGLYFIESLLRRLDPELRRMLNFNLVERLLPFGGIRIEDNLVVEPSGARNLTREAFAALGQE